ncbi:unnamed protein product [Schistosoma curassoni]|uniref:Kinesin motor domain-containing protein n=1 Tax=Schistosoma curassoni TaxID=6186 RepID=A0A183JGH0_9TREM|nr:unnamed protein product [Schistosoma curassoni]
MLDELVKDHLGRIQMELDKYRKFPLQTDDNKLEMHLELSNARYQKAYESIKTSTSERKHGIQWTARMELDDLDFTDDRALLSHTQQQTQGKTTSVAAALAAVGLNIHKWKSKVLCYNTACTNSITIDVEDMEDVKTFTYLVSIIDEHGRSVADVKAQIGKARAVYLQLKNVWS